MIKWLCVLMVLVCATTSWAQNAPRDYVATHPDYGHQQRVTQAQPNFQSFVSQFEQLRKQLTQDHIQVQDDSVADESNYWVCVRIGQLHDLFANNRQYKNAFNQRFGDMDFDTTMDYWHSDNQSRREICYQSELFYSDRP